MVLRVYAHVGRWGSDGRPSFITPSALAFLTLVCGEYIRGHTAGSNSGIRLTACTIRDFFVLRQTAQNRLPIANYRGLKTGAHLASFSGAAVTSTVCERRTFL